MIPKEDLLTEIHDLADGDTPPTSHEMASDGDYGVATYERRFGSWSDALRAAGYSPHIRRNISEDDLLTALRTLANGRAAPTAAEMQSNGEFSKETYRSRFGSYWRGVVRAGLTPQGRHPLTDHQFKQMVAAAHDQQKPRWALVTLLYLFTGLPPEYVSTVTADRVTSYATGTTVTIPGSETVSGDDWEFRLPATWADGRETELPGLLSWYLNQYGQLTVDPMVSRDVIHRVARDAGINRPTVDTGVGQAPDVTPRDLHATGGVRMARNGAPAQRIRRHLGIKHTNWRASVEDFFVWCEVHDDNFSHPDWDGFD